MSSEPGAGQPATFPIEYTYGLRATRLGVLDVRKIDTLIPGKQIFPNHIVIPQDDRVYRRILALLRLHFHFTTETEIEMENRGKQGVRINYQRAAGLVNLIKTHSRNIWRDNTISEVIRRVATKFDGNVMLRFRTAERTVGDDGFISTGTLFGGEVQTAQQLDISTLWVMATTSKAGSSDGGGHRFMYPAFIIPDRYPTLFMYNRGQ